MTELPYLLPGAMLVVVVFVLLRARRGWLLRGRAPEAAPIDLAAHTIAVRAQAIADERERIYADLHDDLGAKLLGLIHTAESPQQADLARAILQDLRDVVTRSRGTPGTVDDVLADIRAEAAQRLASVGIALAWDAPDPLPDRLGERELDTERALHIHRIVREAISNTIRHAHAARLRVRVRAERDQLRLELTDDGSGAEPAARPGTGMRSMRERAAELDGDIRWTPGTEGGTKVLLALPLTLPIDGGTQNDGAAR